MVKKKTSEIPKPTVEKKVTPSQGTVLASMSSVFVFSQLSSTRSFMQYVMFHVTCYSSCVICNVVMQYICTHSCL